MDFEYPLDFRRENENENALKTIEKAIRCCRETSKLKNTLDSILPYETALRQKLRSFKPTVSVGIEEDVSLFTKKFEEYTQKQTMLYANTRIKWYHRRRKLTRLRNLLEGHFHQYGGRVLHYAMEHVERHLVGYEPTPFQVYNLRYQHYKLESLGMYQELLMEMLEGQSDEIKDYYLFEKNRFIKHLSVVPDIRPVVQLTDKPYELPFEIQCLIFEQLDLEDCVQLRQVNQAWYSAYQNSEHILKPKLMARFPFMSESTWSDSVLVFVSRMQNPKWTVVEELDDIQLEKGRSTEVVASLELKVGEKLPANFEPLDSPYMDSLTRTMSMEYGYDDILFFDPWSLSVRIEDNSMVVEEEQETTIVRNRDCEIRLPADMFSKAHISERPQIRRHTIELETDFKTVLLSREKSLNGYQYDYTRITQTYEVGHLTVFKKTLDDSYGTYKFVDISTTGSFKYGPLCQSEPCTAYRGLIWWGIKAPGGLTKGLAPTFVDLQTGKIYYRKDWSTISFFEGDINIRQHQSGRPGTSNRFVFKRHWHDRHNQMIDLESKTVTHFHAPEDALLIPGFVNGRFSLRHVTYDVIRHYAILHDPECKYYCATGEALALSTARV